MIASTPHASGVVRPDLLNKVHEVYMAIIAFEQANDIQLDERDVRPILCGEHPLYDARFRQEEGELIEIVAKQQ